MRCALSNLPKLRASARAKRERKDRAPKALAPRSGAHNPKLCGAAEVSGKEGNLKTVEIRIDTASPGESHGEVTSDKNQ